MAGVPKPVSVRQAAETDYNMYPQKICVVHINVAANRSLGAQFDLINYRDFQ